MRAREIMSRLLLKPEVFFAVTAIIFGITFIIVTPPLQGPDEQAHFAQVYRYSSPRSSHANSLPAGVVDTFRAVLYADDIRFKGNEKYEPGRTKHALLNIPLNKNQIVDASAYGGTGYSPISYLGSILMVWLGQLLNAPAILLIYLARLGGLLSFIGLLYLSIRILPIGKTPMSVAALLPMSIFSASVVSSDAVTLGATAFFLATILSITIHKIEFGYRTCLWLMASTVLLLLTKTISAVLLPLLLLIILNPGKSKSKRKTYLGVTGLLLISVGIMVLWQMIMPEVSNSTVTNIPKNVIPSEQISLMIHAPYKFLFALWNTYFYSWGDGIAYSLIGTFGWADAPMSALVVILGYVIIAFSFLVNRDQDSKTLQGLVRGSRLLIGVTALLYFIAVNAGMYIYYSPVDFNIIVGLQGRYFLPLLFLSALIVAPLGLRASRSMTKVLFAICAPIVLLIISTVYIIVRYYVNTII